MSPAALSGVRVVVRELRDVQLAAERGQVEVVVRAEQEIPAPPPAYDEYVWKTRSPSRTKTLVPGSSPAVDQD
jgi:hypothetical protein